MEKTIRHVQQLKDTLQAIKENNILKMYVDQNVLNFMGTREFEQSLTASETTEATIAFIDICGFTAISEKEPPDTVVKLLNRYHDIVVKEILMQNGIVDKFMGDCVMAVFKGEYHLDRCIESALAIRKRIDSLPAELTYSPRVSIGINSGEVVSGNVGSSSLKRLDYTVIGDVVNTAQRLQSAAGPGQIFINASSHEKIKASFVCKAFGELGLKNKAAPMLVFEVIE